MGNGVIDSSFIQTTVGLLWRGEKHLKARWRLRDYARKKETELARWLERYRHRRQEAAFSIFYLGGSLKSQTPLEGDSLHDNTDILYGNFPQR